MWVDVFVMGSGRPRNCTCVIWRMAHDRPVRPWVSGPGQERLLAWNEVTSSLKVLLGSDILLESL